jgi:hypothetical protein
MYPQAIYQTMKSMGPQYVVNIYNWVKSAVYDAPLRLYLDIELEKLLIERHLSLDEGDEEIQDNVHTHHSS